MPGIVIAKYIYQDCIGKSSSNEAEVSNHNGIATKEKKIFRQINRCSSTPLDRIRIHTAIEKFQSDHSVAAMSNCPLKRSGDVNFEEFHRELLSKLRILRINRLESARLALWLTDRVLRCVSSVWYPQGANISMPYRYFSCFGSGCLC